MYKKDKVKEKHGKGRGGGRSMGEGFGPREVFNMHGRPSGPFTERKKISHGDRAGGKRLRRKTQEAERVVRVSGD